MDYRETIITGSDFTKMGATETKDYVAHVLCLQGSCSFIYNDKQYNIQKNNLLIVREHHLLKDFSLHEKFEVTVLYINIPFMDSAAPDANFGVRSTLLLMENPILELTEKEAKVCQDDMNAIVKRADNRCHAFYLDALAVSCLQFFLDIFHFEDRIYGPTHVPLRSARLIRDFIKLLQNGEYKLHRSEKFNFSSPAHFTRYVQAQLGESPSAIRER